MIIDEIDFNKLFDKIYYDLYIINRSDQKFFLSSQVSILSINEMMYNVASEKFDLI